MRSELPPLVAKARAEYFKRHRLTPRGEKDFAAYLGTKPKTVARWVSGEAQPTAAEWRMLFTLLPDDFDPEERDAILREAEREPEP